MNTLAFMAHPDDVEITCAGTLLRVRGHGNWSIALATMTSGDCGSMRHRPEEIARIRHDEAVAAARLLGADYQCAGLADGLVVYQETNIKRTVEIIRKAAPHIVITQPSADYMVDHEMTGQLVRAACFMAPIPNFVTHDPDPAPPLSKTPHLYYAMPLDNKDIHGHSVEPDFVVDISDVLERKAELLACHASQRDWLRAHHGMDEYIEAMKRQSAEMGARIGRPYGEGFRQHLGHGYPQDNLLQRLLD